MLKNNCYYVHYIGDHNKNIHFFISTLRSPHRDYEKEIMTFLPIATMFTTPWIFCSCYYAHYAIIMTKNTNYFSFQHCFHYTVIMRVKHFAIATTFTMPWSWQEINFFHFNTTFITQLSWEKSWSIVSLRKFSVSKRFVHDAVVLPSGISMESLSTFFPQEIQCF